MKSRLYYILSVVVIVLCLTSCKDNYYIESKLHGLWQMVSIESLTTNEVIEARGEFYYAFQRSVVALCYKELNVPETIERYIAHFDLFETDSVGMGDFRKNTSGEGDKNNLETKVPLEYLHKFGLYQDYTIFHMQQSKQRLILSSDSVRILLRKY